MKRLLDLKFKQLLAPQLKDDGDFSGNTYIDTSELAELLFVFNIGATDAAVGSTDEATAPLIEECDTTGGSYTAVSSAALSAVIAADGDNLIRAISVNLIKSHKRYMRVQQPHAGAGIASGANLSILAIASPKKMPVNAADMGLAELVTA